MSKETILKLIKEYTRIKDTDDYDRIKIVSGILLSEECKIFKCPECGRLLGYFDLEDWLCDFDNDEYICSECYELDLGDDL